MIQSVKKWLLILLLLVLPLQISWAAAAVYCQHEQEAAVAHIGHHEHQHPAQVDASDDQDGQNELPQVHSDCGYCHGVSQAAFLSHLSPMMMPTGLLTAEPHSHAFSSHIPDGPRRPDRHPVA